MPISTFDPPHLRSVRHDPIRLLSVRGLRAYLKRRGIPFVERNVAFHRFGKNLASRKKFRSWLEVNPRYFKDVRLWPRCVFDETGWPR